MFYEFERGTKVWNKDTRDTFWIGKVGLIYPSDYGYATSGSSKISRYTCLNTELYAWDKVSDCYTNNWIYNVQRIQWTITPQTGSIDGVFRIENGNIENAGAWGGHGVHPVVFLKNDIKILSGDGSECNQYKLV